MHRLSHEGRGDISLSLDDIVNVTSELSKRGTSDIVPKAIKLISPRPYNDNLFITYLNLYQGQNFLGYTCKNAQLVTGMQQTCSKIYLHRMLPAC